MKNKKIKRQYAKKTYPPSTRVSLKYLTVERAGDKITVTDETEYRYRGRSTGQGMAMEFSLTAARLPLAGLKTVLGK